MGKGTGFLTPRYDVRPPSQKHSSTSKDCDNSNKHVVHVTHNSTAGQSSRTGCLAAQDRPESMPVDCPTASACTSRRQHEACSPPGIISSSGLASHRSAAAARHSTPAASAPISSVIRTGSYVPAAHRQAVGSFSWQSSSLSNVVGVNSDQVLSYSSLANSYCPAGSSESGVPYEACISSWDEQHTAWGEPGTVRGSSVNSSCNTPAVHSLMQPAPQFVHSHGASTAAAAAAAAIPAALQSSAAPHSSSSLPHSSSLQLLQLSQLPQVSSRDEAISLCTAADRIIPFTGGVLNPALQQTWNCSFSRQQQGALAQQQGAVNQQQQQQQQQHGVAGDDATLEALLQLSTQLAAAKGSAGTLTPADLSQPLAGSSPVELSPISSSVFNCASDQVLGNALGLDWRQVSVNSTASLTHTDLSFSPTRLRLLPLHQQLSGQQQQQVLTSTPGLLSGELYSITAGAGPTHLESQISLQAQSQVPTGSFNTPCTPFSTFVGSQLDMGTVQSPQVTLSNSQLGCGYSGSDQFSPMVSPVTPGALCVVGNAAAAVAAAVAKNKLAQMQQLEALQAQLRDEVTRLLVLI